MNRDRAWRRGKTNLASVFPAPDKVDHPVNHQPNRWAKQHPMDCGNPRCCVCTMNKDPDRVRDARKAPIVDDQDAA
jgi:hypothetical protein